VHSETVLYAPLISFVVPYCYQLSNFQREVQERELAVIREFESRILSLQDEDSAKRLAASTAQSESLARLSRSFRQFMRSVGGEEVDRPSSDSPKTEDFESWSVASSSAELALERDCELARLEKENEELRRMLGMDMRDSGTQSSNANEPPTTVPSHDNRTIGTILVRTSSTGPHTLNHGRLVG
jgi:hypothetical protein